jgi:hypothetical protein
MTIEQVKVCEAVARHFGVKKATITEAANKYFNVLGADHPILELDLVEHINVTLRFFCSKNTMKLSDMFFHKKLKKTELYSDILNTFNNTHADALVFLSGKAPVVIHEGHYYSGIGGILMQGEGRTEGYICEPIEHYLEEEYPKINYRDEC